MKKIATVIAFLFLISMLLACGGNIKVGPPPAGPGSPGSPGAPTSTAVDPAEEAAIQTVQKHGGLVTHDDSQPNRPVIAVNVWQPSFTDADLEKLASLSKLRKIRLNTKINGSGLKPLAGLKDLTELELWGCPIGEAGLKNLAALKGLKVLWLSGASKLTDASFTELKPLTQLEDLHVEGMQLGDTAGVHIASNLPSLKKLNIGNNQIGDVGVMALARMPKLESLYLHGTSVKDPGFAALIGLNTLQTLHVSFSDVTDKTAKILARCKNLQVLHLFSTGVTDAGLQELGNLPNLKELDVSRSKGITNAGIAQFIKDHPKCSVKQ